MRKLLLGVGLGLLMLGGAANAGEATQKEELEALKARVKTLEAETEKKGRLFAGGDQWIDRVTLSGSLRYRYEWLDTEELSGEDLKDTNRNRIQAKINLSAVINEQVKVYLGLATGSDDPTSTNQTLQDDFTTKGMQLDIAYFVYKPAAIDGLSLLGGKMKNPFHRPGKNELIWDSDLRPEGLAAKYTTSVSDSLSIFTSGGAFWVEERDQGADSGLFGIQGGLTYKDLELFGINFKLTGGLSYFDYGNIQDETAFDAQFDNNANAGGVYLLDYDLFEAFFEVGFKAFDLPFTVLADYVNNTAAGQDDWGLLLGLKVGKCKDPGSWAFRYFYRRVEADAVVGVFTDSDFANGDANSKGHEVGFDYQVAQGWTASLTYFNNDRNMDEPDERDYQRLQLDLKFKF